MPRACTFLDAPCSSPASHPLALDRNDSKAHHPGMASKKIIKPSKSAPAVGPYNHGVRTGDLLFCAGQIPLDPASGNLVPGDIKAQTERVLQNVKAILDDQGLTFANVVKSTVFLTNLADFAGMNEV